VFELANPSKKFFGFQVLFTLLGERRLVAFLTSAFIDLQAYSRFACPFNLEDRILSLRTTILSGPLTLQE